MDSERDWFLTAAWPANPRVHSGTTTREGPGLSRPPFDRFNLGEHCGDMREAVVMNRHTLREQLHLPSEPIWLRQQHGIDVHYAEPRKPNVLKDVDTWLEGGRVANSPACEVLDERQRARESFGCAPVHLYSPSIDPEADACITREAGVVLAILHADCLPILICNRQGTEIAAIHAGWRGLAAGVIEATLNKMLSPMSELLVWLGPAAGPTDYEVGQEVREAFVSKHAFANAQFIPTRQGHWLCDLYGLARLRLQLRGVSNVYGGGLSTIADQKRFFSHRREQRGGRMASLIWIGAQA